MLVINSRKDIFNTLEKFLSIIKIIDKNYKKISSEGNIILRAAECIMILVSEVLTTICISKLIYQNEFINRYIELKFIITIIVAVLTYFIMGYILLVSTKIYSSRIAEKNTITADFLLSYLLTIVFSILILFYPSAVRKYFFSEVIGIVTSYLLDMKILFSIMRNPKNIKFYDGDKSSFTRVFIASIIIVFMIVINLFLAVCIANSLDISAFSNNPNLFDLFYYTVVTFTTIGFGDIIPVSIYAKFMAVVISFSNIICITIFLGSIYSNRDKHY